MKAATGELNLTLITVIALGLLLALFTTTLLPAIKNKLTNNWDDQDETNLGMMYENVEFTKYVETELF